MKEAEYREKIPTEDVDGMVEIRSTEIPDGFVDIEGEQFDAEQEADNQELFAFLNGLSEKELDDLQRWVNVTKAKRGEALPIEHREDDIRGSISGQE
jgi:hypothetical protein